MTQPSSSWNAFGTALLRTATIVLITSTTLVQASFSTVFQSPRPQGTLVAMRLRVATRSHGDYGPSNQDTTRIADFDGVTELPVSCELERSHRSTRRCILKGAAGCLALPTSSNWIQEAWADGDGSIESTTTETNRIDRKPHAPLENLLPATRVMVLIDRAVDTAAALVQSKDSDDRQEKEQLIAKLKSLLLEPQEFFKTKQEVSTSKTYLEQKTWSDWKRARQEETRKMFQIRTDPATELNEAFEQWGERRQFKRLRRQQLALEQSNKIRAAFNAYTNNLIFGESYTLNASREEKKRLIRQYDQLPDVTSVIRSDLDLRDLYRNQVLTAVDDANAELKYQLNGDEPSEDFTELLSILREAQSSCSEWFKFVPENDLKQALEFVLREQ